MFKILILLFIFVPLIEIYLLIEIGTQIGAIPTIALIMFTAVLGVSLLRLQGLITLAKVRHSMDHGEIPAAALLEGLMLLIAAVLLLTPGFFTDSIGFLCLIPNIRSLLANNLLKRLIETQNRRHQNRTVTLEGEFWEEDK